MQQVEFEENHILRIILDNGMQIQYDMRPELKKIRFKDIEDMEEFRKGTLINHKLIRWNELLELTLEEIIRNVRKQSH